MARIFFALLAAGAVWMLPAAAADEFAASPANEANPMTVVLDARQAPRGLMYVRMTIPARPGPFTLVYPKWIPGEHGPTGPLRVLSQLRVSAGGHALAWQRDQVDLYAFHLTVPSGVSQIDVEFTGIINAPEDVMATKNVAIVNWNRYILYQADTHNTDVFAKPSVILPAGWKYGTALPDPRQNGDRVDFGTVSLETLVDSPLDMGRYSKRIDQWSNGSAAATIDIFADKPQDLNIDAKVIKEYKNYAGEGIALYGARHWNYYHALLTLSDEIGFQGIEHHQSSDDRAADDFMTDADEQLDGGDLLTHEYSHSWNGKYRRPFDLQQPNFQTPEHTELLWVYEGMNQYLGDVISFRAGIREPKDYPEFLADTYAQLDAEPGRETTPLIDTTTGAPYYYEAHGPYSSLRRTSGDFYSEGELIWLDADTIIRQQTGGAKSMDDFWHLYAGPPETPPKVVTYTREDIEHLLNEVTPYDWHGFFERYVYEIAVHPPTDMIERSGWRLAYSDKPNKFTEAVAKDGKTQNLWYSIGTHIHKDGTLGDVRQGSAAWNAGLAPGMKIVAVNHQEYDSDVMEDAIKNAQHDRAPIELLVQQQSWYGTYSLNYHDGLRYPHLVRVPDKPDMLAKIMAPHAK